MKTLEVSGSHHEIGVSYGSQAKECVEKFLNIFFSKLESLKVNREKAFEIAERLEEHVKQYAPALLDEIQGIAEGADKDYNEILSLNCIFEIPRIAGKKEAHYCTVWGSVVNGEVIAIQNLDLASEYAELLHLLHITPERGKRIRVQVLAGMLGMMGMNEDGLVFSGTTVSSKKVKYGVPKPFLGRSILNTCTTAKQAVDCLLKAPRTTGGNAMLLDAEGGFYIVECSAEKCAVLHPEQHYLFSTNHYTDCNLEPLSPTDDIESSKARLKRIQELFANTEKHDLETLKKFARDHDGEPGNLTICRHGNISTVSSIIFEPAKRRMWIASGLPCENEYTEYTV
jgi:isopenicillin-N N-acyltransferase-like protein